MAEVLLTAMGITLLVITVVYRGYHTTGDALFYGMLGNLLLGAGIWSGLHDLLNRKFGNWLRMMTTVMPSGKNTGEQRNAGYI